MTPRKSMVAVGGSLIVIGLLSACGRKAAPTQPSPNIPPAPPASSPVLVDLRVDGPASLAPGDSVQYTATASYSDGSTHDVTSQAQWSSTNASVLMVAAAGATTARSNGDAEVRAAFGSLSHSRDVVIVPAGRYRLRAAVTEDQLNVALDDVRVEVVSGPAAGLAATTNWEGSAALYGVPQDAQVRFTKNGYQPLTQDVRLQNNGTTVRVQLVPSRGRLDLAGQYQLTISSGSCSGVGALPELARTRTYTAALWNSGLFINVQLSGANFAVQWCPICHEDRGNRFTGQTQALDARFTLNDYEAPFDWNDGFYPNVVERLSDGTLLAISGHAIVTPTSRGYAGTLDGSFSIYNSLDLVSQGSQAIVTCRSDSHRFVLVR